MSMFYNAKEGVLSINGIEIDYITFGKGDKTLIMIQGLNTNSFSKRSALSLAYMYRHFTKDYTVYLFDRRKNFPKNVTVRELAFDIAMAMDELKIKKADILGVSQGGMIAQYLAIDRPELVNKLALAVTASRNNNIVEAVIKDWTRMTEQGDFQKLVKDMAVKMYSDTYVKKYQLFMPLLTIVQKPKDVSRFITLAKACLTCEAYNELEKIKCPVYVIGGRQDKIVGARASEEIAEKLGCEIYMYDDLGHAVYEEAKDFNEKIYNFLNL